MDWALIGSILGMVGMIVVAILQKKGKTEAAAKASEALDILTTVIKGVEQGTKQNPSLKGVKGFITAAASSAGVQNKLHDLVKKLT